MTDESFFHQSTLQAFKCERGERNGLKASKTQNPGSLMSRQQTVKTTASGEKRIDVSSHAELDESKRHIWRELVKKERSKEAANS
jgi:hypothetical protein